MDRDKPVISVNSVSKDFKLPHEKQSTLKSVFTTMLRKHDQGFELQHALRDITFKVHKGEFFGVVGRNGSGKSTLLKMLAGIYQPSQGEIETRGKLVPFIELGVGFNPELTGRENVYLNGALLGFSRKEIDDMYDEVVEFAELERFMDQKLKNYSSGMQVRLAFATATRSKADILIVDEVLAVGDADFQKKCFKYFKSLKNTDTTVVLVTHDMGSVRDYCDNAILLEKGRILAAGDVKDVTRKYSELFNPLSNSKANTARWGDQRIKIEKVKATPIDSGAKVVIDVEVSASENISDPAVVVAYAVKNDIEQALFGNKIESKEFSKFNKGQKKNFRFTFVNSLNEGKYNIDVSLLSKAKKAYYDCWIDCARFKSEQEGVDGYSMIIEDKLEFAS